MLLTNGHPFVGGEVFGGGGDWLVRYCAWPWAWPYERNSLLQATEDQ